MMETEVLCFRIHFLNKELKKSEKMLKKKERSTLYLNYSNEKNL